MFAEVNDEQPIYRGEQNMNHVLDPDDRYAALPDHFDDLRKLMTLAVSKAAGDFIQQEENWFGRERARELKAFSLEKRQRTGGKIGFIQ